MDGESLVECPKCHKHYNYYALQGLHGLCSICENNFQELLNDDTTMSQLNTILQETEDKLSERADELLDKFLNE
jgi:protein-arginine kinase activator protein McsA